MLPHSEAGEGPVVVLLHAGIADRSMWVELLEPVAAAGYRVVAFDLPGFGDAAPRPGLQTPWIDLLVAMDELGIGAAAIIGNSWGGAVALCAVLSAPGRFWGLGMVSAPAPGVDASPELEAAWALEEAAMERGDLDAAVEAVVDTWTLPGAPPALQARIAAMQRRAFEQQLAAPEAKEAIDPSEQSGALASVQVPTLVAVGTLDRPDFLLGAEVLADGIPGARHELIEGAGHVAPLETPDAFLELVLGWLATLDPAD